MSNKLEIQVTLLSELERIRRQYHLLRDASIPNADSLLSGAISSLFEEEVYLDTEAAEFYLNYPYCGGPTIIYYLIDIARRSVEVERR